MKVSNIFIEYQKEPIGLDEKLPRLSVRIRERCGIRADSPRKTLRELFMGEKSFCPVQNTS